MILMRTFFGDSGSHQSYGSNDHLKVRIGYCLAGHIWHFSASGSQAVHREVRHTSRDFRLLLE
jgi:hypothetical protein